MVVIMSKKLKQRIERLEQEIFGKGAIEPKIDITQVSELLYVKNLSASPAVMELLQEQMNRRREAGLDLAYMTQALNKALTHLGELNQEFKL